MESKQSFGAYILKRRKELGMTQKEFADQLFVTDSAVSKWERGLAYPDITLLQSICQILKISEKELLTSTEDVEGRRAEQLARRYLRLIRNYRLIQFLLYGLTALACLISNLAAEHTLDWFWIVLTAEAMAASLTLLPSFVEDQWRGLAVLGSFTGSLLLLLAACCLYTGGDWFLVAALWVLFGMGLLFLPYALRRLPLPMVLSGRKASVYLGAETVLLLLALGINFLYCGVGDGFSPRPPRCSLVFGWSSARCLSGSCRSRDSGACLCGRRNGASSPAAGSKLPGNGRQLVFLGGTVVGIWHCPGLPPFVMGEIPWPAPLGRHKALLYLGILSVYLLVCLAADGWGAWVPMPSLPVALLCLFFPGFGWVDAVSPRGALVPRRCLLPGHGALGVPGALVLDRIMLAIGSIGDQPYSLWLQVDFSNWQDVAVRAQNILLLIYIGFGLLSLLCLAIGLWRRKH